MKNHILVIIILLINSCTQERPDTYNEWFDMNLDNEPKEILESYSYSPNDLLTNNDSIVEWWLEQPIKEWFYYKNYTFDSLGFIIQEKSHRISFDSTDIDFFGDITTSRVIGNDSIVVTSYYDKMPEAFSKTIYLLDNHGMPCVKTYNRNGITVTIDSFERDLNNRIIKVFSESFGIDDYTESQIEYALNNIDDPIIEISSGKTIMYNTNDTVSWRDTTKYYYVYDEFENWIIKAEDPGNGISIIVQRTISYYK